MAGFGGRLWSSIRAIKRDFWEGVEGAHNVYHLSGSVCRLHGRFVVHLGILDFRNSRKTGVIRANFPLLVRVSERNRGGSKSWTFAPDDTDVRMVVWNGTAVFHR